jgi:pilus assembly protein Flp/PilA
MFVANELTKYDATKAGGCAVPRLSVSRESQRVLLSGRTDNVAFCQHAGGAVWARTGIWRSDSAGRVEIPDEPSGDFLTGDCRELGFHYQQFASWIARERWKSNGWVGQPLRGSLLGESSTPRDLGPWTDSATQGSAPGSGRANRYREQLWKDFAKSIQEFLVSEDGPTAVEYAVMLALIVIVCLTAIQAIGTNANTKFNAAANALT